jgi:hypothetical protein
MSDFFLDLHPSLAHQGFVKIRTEPRVCLRFSQRPMHTISAHLFAKNRPYLVNDIDFTILFGTTTSEKLIIGAKRVQIVQFGYYIVGTFSSVVFTYHHTADWLLLPILPGALP